MRERSSDAAMSPVDNTGGYPAAFIVLQDSDGDVVHGNLDNGYTLRLFGLNGGGATVLRFTSADRAGEAAEEIRDALAIYNRAIDRTQTAGCPLPEPADCHHTVRIETSRGGTRAICATCTTVLVRDVDAWAGEKQEWLRRFDTIAAAIQSTVHG